jgi:hypothetical protein
MALFFPSASNSQSTHAGVGWEFIFSVDIGGDPMEPWLNIA